MFQPLLIGLRRKVAAGRQYLESILQAVRGYLLQIFLDAHAIRGRKVRQIVSAKLHFEITTHRQLVRIFKCLGQVCEQFRHCLGALEVLFFAIAVFASLVRQQAAVMNADPRFMGPEIGFVQEAHIVAGNHRQIE